MSLMQPLSLSFCMTSDPPHRQACLQEHLHKVKVQTQQHHAQDHNLLFKPIETNSGNSMTCIYTSNMIIDLLWYPSIRRHFNWRRWEASLCLPRRCWSGISCRSVWMALRRTRWETSRSSTICRICTRDSTRWTLGRSWRPLAHRSGTEVSLWEKRREDARLCRSHRPFPKAGTSVRSHSQDGRTSRTSGSLRFYSFPIKHK